MSCIHRALPKTQHLRNRERVQSPVFCYFRLQGRKKPRHYLLNLVSWRVLGLCASIPVSVGKRCPGKKTCGKIGFRSTKSGVKSSFYCRVAGQRLTKKDWILKTRVCFMYDAYSWGGAHREAPFRNRTSQLRPSGCRRLVCCLCRLRCRIDKRRFTRTTKTDENTLFRCTEGMVQTARTSTRTPLRHAETCPKAREGAANASRGQEKGGASGTRTPTQPIALPRFVPPGA